MPKYSSVEVRSLSIELLESQEAAEHHEEAHAAVRDKVELVLLASNMRQPEKMIHDHQVNEDNSQAVQGGNVLGCARPHVARILAVCEEDCIFAILGKRKVPAKPGERTHDQDRE